MTPRELARFLRMADEEQARADAFRASMTPETPAHYADLRSGGLMHSEVPQWVWRPPAWVFVLAAAMAVGIVTAVWKAVMWWLQ